MARFLLDPTDTVELVANVDAFVDLPDGSTWALTIFTIDEVGRLLSAWRTTGEAGNGTYFWTIDQLIVPEPSLRAMIAAIRAFVDTGDITYVDVRADAANALVAAGGNARGAERAAANVPARTSLRSWSHSTCRA